jgi:hypothetical protein
MEVEGYGVEKIKRKLAEGFVKRLEQHAKCESAPISQENNAEKCENLELEGIHLAISSHCLVFETTIELLSKSTLTLYNRGTVAIHFEWTRCKKPHINHVLCL